MVSPQSRSDGYGVGGSQLYPNNSQQIPVMSTHSQPPAVAVCCWLLFLAVAVAFFGRKFRNFLNRSINTIIFSRCRQHKKSVITITTDFLLLILSLTI